MPVRLADKSAVKRGCGKAQPQKLHIRQPRSIKTVNEPDRHSNFQNPAYRQEVYVLC